MISPVTTTTWRRDARQVERNSKGKRKSQVQLSSGSSALEASKWDVQLIAHCFRYYIMDGWMDGWMDAYIYIYRYSMYKYIYNK